MVIFNRFKVGYRIKFAVEQHGYVCVCYYTDWCVGNAVLSPISIQKQFSQSEEENSTRNWKKVQHGSKACSKRFY